MKKNAREMVASGLHSIIRQAESIVNADDHTNRDAFEEQAKVIMYEAEALLDYVEEGNGRAEVGDTGRTDSTLTGVQ